MERLTDDSSYCTSWTDCPGAESRCKFKENCYDRKIYEKLRFYEDLEEHLEKVYGEHDRLLETVVKSLVKYNGEKPRKSRLLTDEDADKWEMYKDAEEQGLLIRLPVAEGSTVYVIDYILECKYDYDCKEVERCKCENDIPCGHEYKKYRVAKAKFVYGMMAILGKTVFLTREEAEAALAEMER